MEKWPNLFIVGAPKAGTSSLYAYLSDIPGIFMSPLKEPNYFSLKNIPNNSRLKPIRDKLRYLSLFKKVKDEKVIGEASPEYLSDPEASKLIHEIIPDAKIIISIRDPVERTFSHYLMNRRNGIMKDSFYDEFQKSLKCLREYNVTSLHLRAGLYADDVQRYIDTFGLKQIKILIFEEFIKDPKKTIKEILTFLNINYELDSFTPVAFNKFGGSRGPISQFILRNTNLKRAAGKILSPSVRRIFREKILLKNEQKPKMNQQDRDILIKFYSEDVSKLEKILGRSLPWKNFQ